MTKDAQLSSSHLALYEFIFRTSAEGILQVDSEDHCCLMNPAAAAMLQTTQENIIGKTPATAFPQIPALVRLLRRGSELTLDVRLPNERIAQGTGHDLPDASRVVLLNDVTEQRNIESRRDALVKAISHDLRNPISAISGYADLVSKFGDLNERQTHFIRRIQQTSDKLRELTAGLVDLAWIEAGMPLQYKPIELASLIRKAVKELTLKAQSHGIRIVISTQEPMPTLMGDPERIKRAIYHVIDNAIQYSSSESNVGIHAWQQGNKVFCSIADRGFGMIEGDLEKIWDRMWRSTDERVMAIPGGGIGLTYVRTIIRRHGGSISAESRFNEGTTITFMLPLVAEK
jgi:signal transduction histidine kinase